MSYILNVEMVKMFNALEMADFLRESEETPDVALVAEQNLSRALNDLTVDHNYPSF